ncbi:hypothetical protein ACFX1T_003731 [Malus domestica]
MQKLARPSLLRSLRLLKSHKHLRIHRPSLGDVVCKMFDEKPAAFGDLVGTAWFPPEGRRWVYSAPYVNTEHKAVEPLENSKDGGAGADGAGDGRVKRKKLKGKRAVVRWLKFFRYKKKKYYERMTAEEKILHKLRKAHRKEERLVEALKKIEPSEPSEANHDPEILTPEEHFFFLKMGLKCKNYVPVGRRDTWVVVKTFSPEEVKEIASELARLTGRIVLGIHEEYTIIMYRGKNYYQPPTEIMSPRITLSRKKALDKSKYKDGLRTAKRKVNIYTDSMEETQETGTESTDNVDSGSSSKLKLEALNKVKEMMDRSKGRSEDDLSTDVDISSDSEDLSDIFCTDSDKETEKKADRPLYLEEFEKFTIESDGEPEDFKDHLRQISRDAKKDKSLDEDAGLPNFDEVDRIFLRAASLLRKKSR